MKLVIGSLVLNEFEWLSKLVEQHSQWPGLVRWIFVEAADREYQAANPDMVSPEGLSVDGTSSFLDQLARDDSRVTYIPHGFSSNGDKAQGKVQARQRYLDVAKEECPDFVIMVDADEFYTFENQQRINDVMQRDREKGAWSWTFPKREIWRPPSIADAPLLSYEVRGGFWDIPCCHWWRWHPTLRYCSIDHNIPVRDAGTSLRKDMRVYHRLRGMPEMLHLGFAASEKTRESKRRYYEGRGEATDPKRMWYVESRAAWKDWKPGDALPSGAHVVPFDGIKPECFR